MLLSFKLIFGRLLDINFLIRLHSRLRSITNKLPERVQPPSIAWCASYFGVTDGGGVIFSKIPNGTPSFKAFVEKHFFKKKIEKQNEQQYFFFKNKYLF